MTWTGQPPTIAQDEAEAGSPLIFAWETAQNRIRFTRQILILLVCTAVGHVGSFYGLQALYTTPAALPPKPARITLLAPHSPGSRALERWLGMADPALAITTPGEPTGSQTFADLASSRYTPSFATPLDRNDGAGGTPAAALLGVFQAAALRAGSSERTPLEPDPLGPLPELISGSPSRSVLPPPARVSTLRLAAPLQQRLLPGIELPPIAAPPAPPPGKVAAPGALLQPTTLLLYVAADGGPPLVFLQTSSGQADADEVAQAYAVQLPFGTTSGEATWGEAVLFWGRDGSR